MKTTVCSITILMSMGLSGWAFTPMENARGVRWESASAESWSASAQSGPSGAILHLAGASEASVDTTNGAGVTGFLGLLDRIVAPDSATPTPTPCMAGLLDSDFDLDGIPGIDARDLLLLYTALRESGEHPYDFDCDEETGVMDLFLFSQRWQIKDP